MGTRSLHKEQVLVKKNRIVGKKHRVENVYIMPLMKTELARAAVGETLYADSFDLCHNRRGHAD